MSDFKLPPFSIRQVCYCPHEEGNAANQHVIVIPKAILSKRTSELFATHLISGQTPQKLNDTKSNLPQYWKPTAD